MTLARFRIGTRLGAGFAVVLSFCAFIALVGVWQLGASADDVGHLAQVTMAKERLVSEWNRNLYAGVRRVAAIAKSQDPSLEAYFADEAKAASVRANEIIKALEAFPTSPEEKVLLANINAARGPYQAVRDAVSQAKRAGNAQEAELLLVQRFPIVSRAYLDAMAAYKDHQYAMIDRTAASIQAHAVTGCIGMAVLGFIALLFGGVAAWRLTRSITGPLARAVAQARAVADGDLTQQLDVQGRDEMADLGRAMQDMQGRLVSLVTQVRQGVDSVGTASGEIASGNLDLSQRTEQAAASLQHTASSIEQLTGTARQTADSARAANQLAATASGVAQRGGAVVQQVVATMDDINASSRKIADIIGTIDGIAFQTNILALNAAVEAARAGEQGRGFAVVASEVRSLAQRSAEAARQIKSLIGASVDKVESGSRLVAEAGTTMNDIVASVQRVNDIIGEISHAAAEQSKGFGEVNTSVADLDRMTQQNAALVEQSAAAAESMKDQASRLGTLVATFRLQAG